MSRLSHRTYYQHWDAITPSELVQVYCCPCCKYPIFNEPQSYGICCLCSWEDDDGDGGGPNGDYTLEEAQRNFQLYQTMYRASHEIAPQYQKPGYKFVHDEKLNPRILDWKKQHRALLEQYMSESDLYRRGEIWQAIQKHKSNRP